MSANRVTEIFQKSAARDVKLQETAAISQKPAASTLYGGIGIDLVGVTMFADAQMRGISVPYHVQLLYCINTEMVYFGQKYGVILDCQLYEEILLTVWNRNRNEKRSGNWHLTYGPRLRFLYSVFYENRGEIDYCFPKPLQNNNIKWLQILIKNQTIFPIYLVQGLDIFYCCSVNTIFHIKISSHSGITCVQGRCAKSLYLGLTLEMIPVLISGLARNCFDFNKISNKYAKTIAKITHYGIELGFLFGMVVYRSLYLFSRTQFRALLATKSSDIKLHDKLKARWVSNKITFFNNTTNSDSHDRFLHIMCFPNANDSKSRCFMGSPLQPRITITVMKKLKGK